MRGKSVKVVVLHHKALIAVVVVMLLVSCMAIEAKKPELVTAHNVTTIKRSLWSNMDTLNKEERGPPGISNLPSTLQLKIGIPNEELSAPLAQAKESLSSRKRNRMGDFKYDNYLNTREYRDLEKSVIDSELLKNPYGNIVTTMRTEHSDAKLASIISRGLHQEETLASSYFLGTKLVHQWTKENRSPENVFLRLKINKVQDPTKLFDGPFPMWMTYVERAFRFRKDGSRVKELENRWAVCLRDFSLLMKKKHRAMEEDVIKEAKRLQDKFTKLKEAATFFIDADAEAAHVMIGVLKKEFQHDSRFLEKAFESPTIADNVVVNLVRERLSAAYKNGE